MTRRTRILLYVLFGFFALSVSFVLTFPFDVLGRFMENEVAKDIPGAALTVNRIGVSFPIGLYLGDVLFEGPTADTDNEPRVTVAAVRVHPAWSKLLTLKPGLSFSVNALGGNVSGLAWMGGGAQHLDITAKGVQLSDQGQLEKLTGLQIEGTVSGKLSMAIGAPTSSSSSGLKGQPAPAGPPTITDGTLVATIDDARIRGGKVMGFSVPDTNLGSPEVEINVTKGEAKIEKLRTKGGDVEANVTGSISVRANPAQSLVHGQVKIRPSDDWLQRNPLIKGALSVAGSFKKSDGSIELPLNGPITRPLSLPGMGRF
jgi:type II secretion system protein N